MGMDLVVRKREGLYPLAFHANCSGWGYLRQALEVLGQDTSKMPELNAGEFVDARRARQWGAVIRHGLDKIRKISVPDKPFEEMFVAADGSPGQEDLTKDDRDWLMEFAEFCEKSSGFWQW